MEVNEPSQALKKYDGDAEDKVESQQSSEPELLNRYNKISNSAWLKETYFEKSIGQVILIEA